MNGANTTGSTALLPWIQEVCASERRLEAHLADLKQLEEGSLHIVAFTSTLTQWLPQITKRFTEAHPHIDLRITCCDDQAQLEHIVESGEADVGFVALPVKRPLEMELLVRDPLLVAVAPDSPFATRKRFPKKALASEPYIKLDSGEYSEMDRLFRVNGVEPRVRFSTVSDYAAMAWCRRGSDTACFRGSCCETLRSTWSRCLRRYPPIAKSHSHRNRARRRRALRGPSSSARKTGSAKPTKAIPTHC